MKITFNHSYLIAQSVLNEIMRLSQSLDDDQNEIMNRIEIEISPYEDGRRKGFEIRPYEVNEDLYYYAIYEKATTDDIAVLWSWNYQEQHFPSGHFTAAAKWIIDSIITEVKNLTVESE